MKKTSISVNQYPFEVIRYIFQITLIPNDFLDSSLRRGPNSAWCQTMTTKRSLMQVCKLWRSVGAEFLYEEVVIRRFTQLTCLLATLKNVETTIDFGYLIKTVEIQCFVPDPLYLFSLGNSMTFSIDVLVSHASSFYPLFTPTKLLAFNLSNFRLHFVPLFCTRIVGGT